MILAKVSTSKEILYVVGEDESDVRDKAQKHLKSRYFSETVQIRTLDIIACSKKRYSQTTLIT